MLLYEMGNTFFLDWQLWHQMTFFLGCSIVIVFGIGLVRLWWTNRVMKRLELEDEEKKSRRSDIQHCGIDSLKIEDIPFGVRALQRGVEVEGIWFATSDMVDFSQIASSATLISDQTGGHKLQGPRSGASGVCPRYLLSESPGSIANEDGNVSARPSLAQSPSTSMVEQFEESYIGLENLYYMRERQLDTGTATYIPRGSSDRHGVRTPEQSGASGASGPSAAKNIRQQASPLQCCTAAPMPIDRFAGHPGSELNPLPTGSSGIKNEPDIMRQPTEQANTNQPKPRRARLKKSRPGNRTG